jgi:dipeptidyl aminopeptidase/acylaminoacyl peptidase
MGWPSQNASFPWVWRLLAVIVVVWPCAGCDRQTSTGGSQAGGQSGDLAAARKNFATRLRVRGPAPQEFENALPPDAVREVEFTSGALKLKGWLSVHPTDGKRRPAVVYLHGGWAFGADDWRDAAPFVEAGFVLFMPMLRGENGNAGNFESFLRRG